jgi:integrase
MKRNRRAGVEDRWTKTVRDEHGNPKKVPSARHGTGKRWMARYVDDEGHEHAKAFDRKADAQTWLDNEVTAKLATGTYVAPKAGLITVEEVYTSWSASQGHLAPSTIRTRHSAWLIHIRPQWGQKSVVDVKTSAVKTWVTKMITDEVGVPMIVLAFGVLRQVLGAAVEDQRIPRNPCTGVKLPKLQHVDRGYLKHSQVAELAEAVSYGSEVIRFLAYTGLRWGEMAALRVQDFDMLRRRVNVSRSVSDSGGRLTWSTPKTGERRSVPFPTSLAEELAALMVGKGRDDLVFTNRRGNVLRGSNYRPRVFDPAVRVVQAATAERRAQELATTGVATTPEFPTITPHGLRHTAASLAISAGANVKAVQRMLGHAKASMTLDVYADLFDDDLDVVADRLDAAIKSLGNEVRAYRNPEGGGKQNAAD